MTNPIFSRTNQDDCLSDFAFDQLAAGELAGERGAHAQTHMQGCARCQARQRELDVAVDPAQLPALQLVPRRPSARLVRPMFAVPALLAAAAVVFLVVRQEEGDGTRSKGAPSLDVVVRRGEATRTLTTNDALHPGDSIRFTATLHEQRSIVVLSLSAASTLLLIPAADEHVPLLDAPAALPGTFVVDDVGVEERFAAVFCAGNAPPSVEEIVRAVSSGASLSARACTIDIVRFEKTGPR